MIEFETSKVFIFVKSIRRQILFSGLVIGSSSVLLLSGCSSAFTHGLQGPSGETVVAKISGKVHGGQFPVSGSSVQVYSVSGAGSTYGAASTPLGTAVTTDSGGNWSYGSFSCASGSDEVYVVSTGGNPGLSGSVSNPALAMTAALGPCSQVGSISFVYIDEVTTVATEYALAGFSTDYLHVGTSPTNTIGLTNAFATVNNLVNITTGQALTTTPAYANPPVPCTTTPAACTPTDTFRSIVPYDLINTLANVLASCVNTDGVTNPACSNLFAITGGSLASPALTVTDTADATLYIAHNPGLTSSENTADTNLTALFNLAPAAGAPFGPALSAAPNDYTMTVNFVGGGLGGVKSSSTGAAQYLAIDQNGNVWVPNPSIKTVTELSNLGAPISNSTTINTTTTAYRPVTLGGYAGGFGDPNRIAIDLSGNAWVSDGVNCLGALNSSGAPLPGSPFTTVCATGAGTIAGVAVDASNNIWVGSETAISSANNAGTIRSGFPVTSGFTSLSSFFGADYTGLMWYIDGGSGSYGALNSNGTPNFESSEHFPFAESYAAFGSLASSVQGNGGLTMWVAQADGVENVQPAYLVNTNTTGADKRDTFPNAFLPDTEAIPSGIAADGSSNFYFANQGGVNGALEVSPNITALSDSDLQLSPYNTGFTGGSALMAMVIPTGVAVDQSGNLWVLNQNNVNSDLNPPAGGTYLGNGVNASNLTEFVGLAAPVNPVFAQDAVNGTYATKP